MWSQIFRALAGKARKRESSTAPRAFSRDARRVTRLQHAAPIERCIADVHANTPGTMQSEPLDELSGFSTGTFLQVRLYVYLSRIRVFSGHTKVDVPLGGTGKGGKRATEREILHQSRAPIARYRWPAHAES